MTESTITLGTALARYYEAHGLPSDGGASAATFHVRLGPVSFRLPNPPARRRAVFFHDANHILTGYNTTFSEGEMEIAAFEIGAGCGPFAIAWAINITVTGLGLIVAPRKTFAAFVRGRHSASIYAVRDDRDALAGLSVEALRTKVAVAPAGTKATVYDSQAFGAFAFLALGTWIIPVLLVAWLAAR